MHEVYQRTALTPMRVARQSGYIDWASQPSLFKQYPEFLFRYPYGSDPRLRLIELSRLITSRSQIGGKPYYRLNTPSAGNLHPIELYVQIRSLKGILSGIYHVNAAAEELVLIREIEGDGLEGELGMKKRFEGMLFLVSCVPFRSEWKYGERSLRYCYLDAGHQIGAIQAAAALDGQDATILSDFDANRLNLLMGFKGEESVCAVLAVGKEGKKSVKRIESPLMQVSPTDYCETKGAVAEMIAKEERREIPLLNEAFVTDESAIVARRSARQFSTESLGKERFEHFMHLLVQPPQGLSCFTLVLEKGFVEPGLYASAELVKAGDYADEISSLLVDQRFVKEASMIAVMTSKCFGRSELISASAFAHRIHLDAQTNEVGFSGIGAFYDTKLQNFLNTKEYILYVCVIGKERK